MARVHGKDSVFTLATNDLSEYIDNVQFSDGVELAEITGLGSTSKSYIPGLKDATITISGRFDSEATGPEATLAAAVGGAAVAFEYGPEGSANGKVKRSGSVFVRSYAQTSPVGDVVAFTADLQVSGDLTTGTYSA